MTQPDSIIPPGVQGYDRYAYVNNSPINLNDPTGHYGTCDQIPAGSARDACNNSGYGDQQKKDDELRAELKNFKAPTRYQRKDMVNYWGANLNPAELSLIQSGNWWNDGWTGLNGALIENDAKSEAEHNFPTEYTQQNDPADAFRHAYWNALLTNHFGASFAEQFTTAHEQDFDNAKDADQETFMDLHNNMVGRDIAISNPGASNQQLEQKIFDAMHAGQLYIWDGKNIYYSNECPECSDIP